MNLAFPSVPPPNELSKHKRQKTSMIVSCALLWFWHGAIMGRNTWKNVRKILLWYYKLSGLSEDSPILPPHQPSLCHVPGWNLMVESKVKTIKRQNCWTLKWKIRHGMAGPFNTPTTKQMTFYMSHWNCRGRKILKIFY